MPNKEYLGIIKTVGVTANKAEDLKPIEKFLSKKYINKNFEEEAFGKKNLEFDADDMVGDWEPLIAELEEQFPEAEIELELTPSTPDEEHNYDSEYLTIDFS